MGWKKDGKPLDEGPEISQTPDFCKIKLKAAKREDRGEYELELENNVGLASIPITIKVIGKHLKFYLFYLASTFWIYMDQLTNLEVVIFLLVAKLSFQVCIF